MDIKEATRLYELCEVCKKEKSVTLINIGLDVGFHIGDYGKGEYKKFQQNPICIGVSSIHLCKNCEEKVKKKGHLYINILPQLKKLITSVYLKQMIIEELK